jgi:hypothetical protein
MRAGKLGSLLCAMQGGEVAPEMFMLRPPPEPPPLTEIQQKDSFVERIKKIFKPAAPSPSTPAAKL